MSTKAKRSAGLLPMYERQASKYYDKHRGVWPSRKHQRWLHRIYIQNGWYG